ncbi:MAG: SusC/RagA family TonB-linked outer membrane protein [Firmicutes bacterium]|nr:SusC/RagA family TonB-linked outer membrane protein [Bacillota bacterium]MCM1401693.1 SusC/RagA family TonB-linked outer membrane protein [Bacteroides sp.]MCM1477501.1 SusC/RagA family TonB-linked outer membrane protein [Bacteroides sp.]
MKKLLFLLAAIVTLAVSAQAQNRTYHGTVLTSAENEPVIGATVTPIGGGHQTVTDIDGKFTLSVPASVKEVKVTFVGYSPVTAPLTNGMTVKLDVSSTMLDAVVVTGYGSGKKLGSVVGSLGVVDNEVLENTPSSNFVDALQGQVPGLSIFSNSGEPNSVPSSIRIRGVNSLNASNTPLFILDGAPATSAVFTTLAPSDIESVTVLKDASSTAIYGSRAANGVIVITTKKGKYGDNARVTVRASVGWSQRANNKIDIMNSEQYIHFRDLTGNPVSQEVRDLVSTYGINTDWRKELIKSAAPMMSMEGRVQGGSEKIRYYLSLGHYDQDGLIDVSSLRRETMRVNLDSKVNNWFQVGLSANFGYEKAHQNSAASPETGNGAYYSNNPFVQAYNLLPYDSPYYYSFNDKGDIVYGDKAIFYHYSGDQDANYVNRNFINGTRTNVTAMMTLYEQLTPVKGLTIRAQQAMNAFDFRSGNFRKPDDPFYTPMGDLVDNSSVTTSNSQSFQRWYQFTYTNTAEYKFTLAEKNHFTLLAGQESIITRSHQFGVMTSGQPSKKMWLLTQGTSVTMDDVSQSIYETVMNSYFFNLSYDFNNKYFLDASVRRDGSSKFAPKHRWSTFYAVGAMWDAKQENFLQDVNWLSDAKLHVNYGTTGNSGIGNYAYEGTVGSGGLYAGQTSLALGTKENDHLSWETVHSFDVGVNLGFWDRLRVNGDFYVKNTKDMLMSVPLSYTTGYASETENIGSMRNVGVDIEVNGDIYQDKDWYVGAGFNFGYNSLKITELFNGLDKFTLPGTGITYEVGKNPFNLHNVRYAGVDPRDGMQMWYTKDGNLTKKYNETDDEVDLGKSYIAPWNGGFNLQARWKGLSLRADFNWSLKKYIFNATYWYVNTASNAVSRNTNGSVKLLNVWTKPGDVTDIPNLLDLYGNPQEVQPDTRFIENASFLRLKNLTLSYSLPKQWVKAIQFSDVQFHFTGRNLFTITDFTGIDPEYEGNVVHFMYPNTRQYEIGVEVSF